MKRSVALLCVTGYFLAKIAVNLILMKSVIHTVKVCTSSFLIVYYITE